MEDLYDDNKILFMNTLEPKLCNRYTKKTTPIDIIDNVSVDCPTKEVMSVVSISQNYEEAEEIIWGV